MGLSPSKKDWPVEVSSYAFVKVHIEFFKIITRNFFRKFMAKESQKFFEYDNS